MKFSDGFWLMRPDVTAYYPQHVHDAEVQGESLLLYGPFQRVEGRRGTTDVGLLTVRLSSPMENVIHVEAWHHQGALDPGPHFAKQEQVPEVSLY
ncbi:MAG: alpha-xylosidase, partial [Chloroflexi bacterium]|nr:alpha-xylosidase [Chloroflexota bacterium]